MIAHLIRDLYFFKDVLVSSFIGMAQLAELPIRDLQDLRVGIILTLVKMRIATQQRVFVIRGEGFRYWRAGRNQPQGSLLLFQNIKFRLAVFLGQIAEHTINLSDKSVVAQPLSVSQYA